MAIDLATILVSIDLIARILSFLGFGIAAYYYFFKRDQSSLFNPFLASAIIFGFATFTVYIFDLITWILFESETTRRFLHGYSYGFLALFIFSWFKHYEAIDGTGTTYTNNAAIIPLSFVWMAIGIFTIKKILFPLLNLNLDYELISDEAFVTIVSHPTWIMGIVVYSYIYQVTKKMVLFTDQLPSKRELLVAKILLFDFILLELSNFMLTFDLIGDALGYLILIIGLLLFEIGFLILVYNSISFPSYQFYLPQSVDAILIYNRAGLILHSVTFGTDTKITETKGNILSSILTALTGLFKEALGYSVELNKINLKGYNVLFLSGDQSSITMVVISTHDNYFLQRGMKEFFENIPESLKLGFDQKVFQTTPDTRRKISELIRNAFPFLFYSTEVVEQFDITAESVSEKFVL